MEAVLLGGAVVGAVLGLIHGTYLYAKMVAVGSRETPSLGQRRIRAFYYAVSTFILWVLLGTTVLVLWAVSLPAYAAKRLIKP